MKLPVHVVLGFALLPLAARAQVGIGTPTPDARAALEIKASDKGLLIPRLTGAQRTAIGSPPQGLVVYQTDAPEGFYYYAGVPAAWVYLNPAGGGNLALPYSGSYSGISNAFGVSNTGIGAAIVATATLSTAVSGSASTGTGVAGASGLGVGVAGSSTGAGTGLSGASATGVAVRAAKAAAVPALSIAGQTGRVAEFSNNNPDNDSTALYVSSVGDRPTLRAVSTAASAQAAIRGVKQAGTDGSGVEGVVTSGGGNAAGVLGNDKSATSTGSGVLGLTTSGYGVRGIASAGGGYGVSGSASGSGGRALIGGAAGPATALYAQATGTGQAGYFAQTSSTSTATALEVQNSSLGSTASFSQTNAGSPAAVVEVAGAGTGSSLRVRSIGTSPYAAAADLLSSSISPTATITNVGQGVALRLNGYGVDNASGAYIGGTLYFGYQAGGIFGTILSFNQVGNNNALQLSAGAQPRMRLNDQVASTLYGAWNVTGSLSKAGGSFRIDHPLDPENQYLYHSFVESPDMLNIYNGNVVLDARGEATVVLPDWFEALNRDFRYQLTPIGAAFTPYVLAEVAGHQFRVAGQPGGKVSWQVTGIRQDKWANQNRIPVEQAKEPASRGKYLHPSAFGRPESQGIYYQPPHAGGHPPALLRNSWPRETPY